MIDVLLDSDAAAHTPRYSCSLPMFWSSSAFGIMSMILPCSIT